MLHKWREIFRTICDRVSIDNYSFISQLHDRIELRNFGDLNISSLSNSIGNIISKSNTKLQIMSDNKTNAVKEALNKAKLWKDYLDQWAGIMRYEQYCNLRRDGRFDRSK
jgi:hypothetical protein